MKIIQYENKFIDLDKVCAFDIRSGYVLDDDKKQVEIFELLAILDSGVGFPLGTSKVKTILIDWVAGQWKVTKKGMF